MAGAANTEGHQGGFLRRLLNPLIRRNSELNSATVQSANLMEPGQSDIEQVQIPSKSGYANWIERLETQKGGVIDLTANELRKLYPHFVGALKNPNLKITDEERPKLLESLNDGDYEVVVKLAEFIRNEYLKGKNIADVRKRSHRHFGNPAIAVYALEHEALLADQLAARVKPQINQVPTGIIKSFENTKPDIGVQSKPGQSASQSLQK